MKTQILKVFTLKAYEPEFNMAVDSHLFSLCEAGCQDAFLRLYQWEPPAISLGMLEKTDGLDLDRIRQDGIRVVRRPTGGRMVLHKGDLTYSVILPKTQEEAFKDVYGRIANCIAHGLERIGITCHVERGKYEARRSRLMPCFVSTSQFEITCQGKKIVGSAQKIGRKSILQHGSIPIDRSYLEIVNYLVCDEGTRHLLRSKLETNTMSIEEICGERLKVRSVADALLQGFVENLGLRIETCDLIDFVRATGL